MKITTVWRSPLALDLAVTAIRWRPDVHGCAASFCTKLAELIGTARFQHVGRW